MQILPLSRAFQTTLARLVTNVQVAARVTEGVLSPDALDPALTAADVQGLNLLVRAEGQRLLTMARILAERRRSKLVTVLPATMRLFGPRMQGYWTEYLDSESVRGAPPAAAEALAFATWLLRRIDETTMEAQFVRYELCKNDVASRLLAGQASDAAWSAVPLAENCRIRLSRYARAERFDWPIDMAMNHFYRTGEILRPKHQGILHLVFHPANELELHVTVTRVPKVVIETLEAANGGLRVRELLHTLPGTQRGGVCELLEWLIAKRLIEVTV